QEADSGCGATYLGVEVGELNVAEVDRTVVELKATNRNVLVQDWLCPRRSSHEQRSRYAHVEGSEVCSNRTYSEDASDDVEIHTTSPHSAPTVTVRHEILEQSRDRARTWVRGTYLRVVAIDLRGTAVFLV